MNESVSECAEIYDAFENISGTAVSPTYPWLTEFGIKFEQLNGFLSLAVCTFGILANTANIVILTRPALATSATNHLLVWLAVADLLTMVVYVPSLYHFYIIRPNPARSPIYTPFKSWVLYKTITVSILIMLHSIAIWITVILAVFRYIHIGFPTVGPRLASTRRAQFSVALTAICCVLLVIPNAMINHVDSCTGPNILPKTNYTKTIVYYYIRSDNITINGVDFEPVRATNFWMQAIIFKLIPSVLLLLLTILLIYELQVAAIRHRKLQRVHAENKCVKRSLNGTRQKGNTQMNEKRTTNLLIAILIIFLIVEMPQGFLVICLHLIDGFYHDVYEPIGDLIDFMTLVKEAINFVIFTSMSQQFRATFWQIFWINGVVKMCKKSKTFGVEDTTSNRRTLLPAT